MELLKTKDVEAYIEFPMVDVVNPESFKAGETVGDEAYYKDGSGSWTSLAITATVTEIGATGIYHLTLTSGEMGHDLIIIKLTASNSQDQAVIIQTESQTAINTLDQKLSNIGSASGGAFNFSASYDISTTDTIDAAAAADKGSGLVGIPVTGHAFVAGREITITGSTNYNNSYTIVSQTANEVVITETYNAETFGGSETIVDSFQGVVFDGVETSGTFASTHFEDGIYHQLDDVANNIDNVYVYNVGGGRTAVEVLFHGYLNSGNDTGTIEVWNGSTWDVVKNITGQGTNTNVAVIAALLSSNTVSGKVYVRVQVSGGSNPTFQIDQLLVAAVNVGQTVGYSLGRIWVDTVGGAAGSEDYVNGVADRPSLLWADALTIANSVGLNDFNLEPGSDITLTATLNSRLLHGHGATLHLGGQDIDEVHVFDMFVDGIGTAATEMEFHDCEFINATLENFHMYDCTLGGTITMSATGGDIHIINCQSGVAGSGSPVIDLTAVHATTTIEFRRWSGGIQIDNIESGDILTIGGELGTVTLNGADGTVEIRGTYKAIVDNRSGSPVINTDGAIRGSEVNDIFLSIPHGVKKNTALANYKFPMVNNTTKELESGLTVTAKRVIDAESSFSSCTNSVTEIGSTGVYRISFSAADLNGDVIIFLFESPGADDRLVEIKTEV